MFKCLRLESVVRSSLLVLVCAGVACSDSKTVNQIVNPACNIIGNCLNADTPVDPTLTPAPPANAFPITQTLTYSLTDSQTGGVVDSVDAVAVEITTSFDGPGTIVHYRGRNEGTIDEKSFVPAAWKALLDETAIAGFRVFESPLGGGEVIRSRGVQSIDGPKGRMIAIAVEVYSATDPAALAGDFANAERLARRFYDGTGTLVRETRESAGAETFVLALLAGS